MAHHEAAQIQRRLRRLIIVEGGGRQVSRAFASRRPPRTVKQRWVQRWWSEDHLPRVERLPELAQILGVRVHWILTGIMNPPPIPRTVLVESSRLTGSSVSTAAVRAARITAAVRVLFGSTARAARATGISRRWFERMAAGENPRAWRLARFAEVTQLSADWLLGGPEPPPQLHLPFFERWS